MPAVPRNRTGKKLELPVKKILLGAAPDEVASRDVLADPTALDAFVALARRPVSATIERVGRRRRHRRDRRELGGALPRPRPRRRRHRPGARRRGAAARRRGRALAGAGTVGLVEGASPERLTFTADPAEAVADADFVQENGPEREDVKHALFAVLDAAARPDVVLASSSSGMLPTRDRPRLPASTRSACWSGTRSTRRT